MDQPQIPLIIRCCGEGCGKDLGVRWVDYNGLGADSKHRYIVDGELVSHGMCDECQLKYYGHVVSTTKKGVV